MSLSNQNSVYLLSPQNDIAQKVYIFLSIPYGDKVTPTKPHSMIGNLNIIMGKLVPSPHFYMTGLGVRRLLDNVRKLSIKANLTISPRIHCSIHPMATLLM